MAEYIDKQKYREEWLKFKTFEPMKCLDLIPIADVIERSKINKAIEEIREYSMPDFEYHGCGGSQLVVETEDVIEILKRNIGE